MKTTWRTIERSGIGTYIWKSGDKYEGHFQGNKRSGYGIQYYANGEKYVGNWANDDRNGFGTFNSANGAVTFNGTWIDNVK